MAKRKSPVKKGTLHLQPKNQGRAAAARMQSKGKLWKKVAKVRTKSAGKETPIHFYNSVDSYRSKVGGTASKAAWLKRMRLASQSALKTKKSAATSKRKATLARSKGRKSA